MTLDAAHTLGQVECRRWCAARSINYARASGTCGAGLDGGDNLGGDALVDIFAGLGRGVAIGGHRCLLCSPSPSRARQQGRRGQPDRHTLFTVAGAEQG